MSEKLPPLNSAESASGDISLSDIREQMQLGSFDDARRLGKLKLDALRAMLSDINHAIQSDAGLISREDWQKEKLYILEQITELQELLKTVPEK